LDQLLKKQATFCKEITFTANHDVRDVDHKFTLQIEGEDTEWTLQKVLMQLAHPNQEECSFFHTINCNRNGSGIMIAMLPNIAQHGSTVVCHLLLFTKWILKPTLGHSQAKKVETAFTAETIIQQTTWQLDLASNCVLQADSTLIRRALNDFPLYNLTTTSQLPTTVTTMVQMTKQPPVAQAPPDQQIHTAAHMTNDLHSLSNSMLS